MYPLLTLAFFMAAGIAVGLWLPVRLSPWWTLSASLVPLSVLSALALWRGERTFRLSHLNSRPLLYGVCLCLCVLLLGTTLCLHQRRRSLVALPTATSAWTVVVASEAKATERSMAVDALTRFGDRTLFLRLYFSPDSASASLSPGQVVRAEAHVGQPHEWRRGSYSHLRYMQARGYQGTAYIPKDKWNVCPTGAPDSVCVLSSLSPFQRLRLRCLVWRHQLLQEWRDVSADEADLSLLMAMTLGDKSRLSRRLQDDYSATGASHVLALSGLHLGILACLLLLAVRHRRLLWFLCPLTILLVWAFALLADLPDSVVRAATMVTLLTLFQTSARKAEALNSLGLAALVMLAVQPLSLLDAGFQLSFLSVLSILALMPLLSWWFSPAEQRFALSGRRPPLWFSALKLLAGFCAVTLVAQIGTAPLVAYHFGRLPLHFLLSSFLVIPLSYSILLLSVLVVLLPWFRPWLMAGLSWLAHTMNAGIGHIASWPHACIEGLHPRALTVLLLYVLAVVVGAMVWWATLRRVPRPWH